MRGVKNGIGFDSLLVGSFPIPFESVLMKKNRRNLENGKRKYERSKIDVWRMFTITPCYFIRRKYGWYNGNSETVWLDFWIDHKRKDVESWPGI